MSKLTRETPILNHRAADDLTGMIGRPVSLSSGGVNLSDDLEVATFLVGILLTEGKLGEEVSVAHWTVSGTVRVRLHTNVTAGSRLRFVEGADALLIAAASQSEPGHIVFGRALEDGKAGDLIEATIFEPFTIPATP
jgi:hypothetical protein